MGESQKILVADWSVVPDRNLLVRGNESITIKPRSMEVLIYLADHAGEVVSTEELIENVWQGRVVGDGTVYQSITNLRKAMGDRTEEARIIETIPKRGYRLVAPVTTTVEPKAHEEAVAVWAGRKASLAAAGTIVLVLVVVATWFVGQQPTQGDDAELLPNSVAVLPLTNLSPNPEHAYFASGIHESIINHLGSLRNLNVIARSSVMQYEGVRVSEIARDLRIEAVMEGSVRYAGDRVLVTVDLIDGATETHLWSGYYDRELSDIFAIQADIATNIANALDAEFSLSEQKNIEKIPTEVPAAYAVYLRALSTLTRDARHAALDQAIQLDPEFALAYSERAFMDTGPLIGVEANTAPDEAFALERSVIADAQRALELDPTLGRAQAALAVVYQANWRGADAERAFQRALELSPNDVRVLWQYGEFKRFRRDYEAAIRLGQRAIELNPNDLDARIELGITHRFAADWDAAAEAFQEVLSLNPASLGEFGLNIQLAYVEGSRGNVSEAVSRLRLAERLGPLPAYRLAQMAHIYVLAGFPGEAAKIFDQFEEQATQEDIGDGWWAYAHVAMGEYDKALQRIQSAVNRRVNADQVALLILAANTWRDPQLDAQEFRALLDSLWIDQ